MLGLNSGAVDRTFLVMLSLVSANPDNAHLAQFSEGDIAIAANSSNILRDFLFWRQHR